MPFDSVFPTPADCLDPAYPPKEVNEARSAEDVLDLSRPYVTRVYRRRFQLTTLSPLFGAGLVREAAKYVFGIEVGVPYRVGVRGQAHYEYDPFSFATRITATPGADAVQWFVDVNYEPIDPQVFDTFDNPLLAPLEIEIDGQKYQEIADYDMDPTALGLHSDLYGNPILNSANDPFDPPVKRDATRSIMTIKRNDAIDLRQSINGFVWDDGIPERYRDTINSTTFRGRGAHKAKVEDIKGRYVWHPTLYDPTASPPLTGYYFEALYTFAFHPTSWDERVLDAGYRTWDTTAHAHKPIIQNGVPATAPVALDGSGQVAPRDGSTEKIVPHYLVWQIYREKNLAADLKFS